MKHLSALLIVLFLQNSVFAASSPHDDKPTKPTPDQTEIKKILRELDCAGVVDRQAVRLKPGSIKPNDEEYEILAESTHPTFPKRFFAVGTYTSREQYIVHGNEPEAFMILIDKFGVHGAHNATMDFPFTPGLSYNFECYFY